MTASPAESITAVEYFPDGKIKKITFTSGNTTSYEYDAMGNKLKSKYYNAGTAHCKYNWYVGPLIYEFDSAGANSFVIDQASIPGGELRVNYATITSSAYPVYHITDHLGNVRATFQGTTGAGTAIDILSYNDYYTFGGKLPGRDWSLEKTRYGYQEQEKVDDGSNPWYQFDLRNYNQDIGRWFAPDPYGQNWSPYSAMANNPVNYIDPDGGYDDPSRWKYSLINDLPEEPPQTYEMDGYSMGALSNYFATNAGVSGAIIDPLFEVGINMNGGSGPGGAGMVYDAALGGLVPYAYEQALNQARNHGPNPGDVSISSTYTVPTKSPLAPGANANDILNYNSNVLDFLQMISDKQQSHHDALALFIGHEFDDKIEPFEGLLGGLKYLWTGGVENGVQYNLNGEAIGPAPIMGIGPDVGRSGLFNFANRSRGLWTLTKEGASVIKNHKVFGTLYKSKSDGLWWAIDKAGHGGSRFKVFKETNKGLEWFKDADEFGDFILLKHKGVTGTFIPWGHLSTVR